MTVQRSPQPVGDVLWERPTDADESTIDAFRRFVERSSGISIERYHDLWKWTVDDVGRGWTAMWDFAGLPARPDVPPLASAGMPGATWFPGTSVNLAELVLTRSSAPDHATAIVHRVEGDAADSLVTWCELRDAVARVSDALRSAGVGPGDHVVAVLPNVPEAMIACLGALSVGAVWSSCAPDFAADAVIERFSQLSPKVLFAASGYRYGGRAYDRRAEVATIQAALPSLSFTVLIDEPTSKRALGWTELLARSTAPPLEFHPTAFEDPAWVLFTSGTTGRPKALVHSHGGAVLGAVQGLLLHLDLHRTDRLAWHTSTGWVVWNILLSSLMFCDSIAIYDGSPTFPEEGQLLRLAADAEATMVGIGGAYLSYLARQGLVLRDLLGGHTPRGLCFTGSAIGTDDYDWAVDGLPESTWFTSVTGGTDIGSTFVLAGNIAEPVRRGQFQCRGLGIAIEAYDEAGVSVVGEPGELVITSPLPSMPLRLLHDPGFVRYRSSYLADFEGVWRHGDLVVLHEHGGGTLLGRSDATLNRNGVRIGTAEIYSAVDSIAGIVDSLIVDLSTPERPRLVLFVDVVEGTAVDRLQVLVATTLRSVRSPRHVPDEMIVVPAIPRTLNGKRVEVPVRRLLMGSPVEEVANRASLANPESLDWFASFAARQPDPATASRSNRE